MKIQDLSFTEELGSKAMAAVRGGLDSWVVSPTGKLWGDLTAKDYGLLADTGALNNPADVIAAASVLQLGISGY